MIGCRLISAPRRQSTNIRVELLCSLIFHASLMQTVGAFCDHQVLIPALSQFCMGEMQCISESYEMMCTKFLKTGHVSYLSVADSSIKPGIPTLNF